MRKYFFNKEKHNHVKSSQISKLRMVTFLCLGVVIFPVNKLLAQCTAGSTEKIISGKVFNDLNINGINDSEAGVQNVDVKIYEDVNQNGVVDVGDVLLSIQTTDINGDYSYTYTSNNKNFADDFSGSVFSGTNNNSGTDNWANNVWIRSGVNGNTSDVQKLTSSTDGDLHLSVPLLQLDDNSAGAYRLVDLSLGSSATLTFDYDNDDSAMNGAEELLIQIDPENDGTYVTLQTISATGNEVNPPISVSINIPSAQLGGANTRIRFITGGNNGQNGDGEDWWIDNVVVNVEDDIDDFVIETDANTYPSGYIISSDNIEIATIATTGNCDTSNDFGIYNADNDGDGIINLFDLDDDNDGILDVDEGMVVVPGSYGTLLADDADAVFEVTPNTNASQLTSYLFAPNSDVTVSGESINIGDGSVNQLATFDDADQITDFGGSSQAFANFSTGLIFSTGNVESFDDNLSNLLYNPDGMGNLAPGFAGGGTDSDFDTGFGEDDVASLSFNVNVPYISTISGRFVFASEEYIEYLDGSYNDNIRILVNGVNQALTPGGAIVSINTINNTTESAYFIDNETDPTAVNIEADGFTTVLVFTATLNVGSNTIKIGIADEGDNEFDSWLLFEANSFEIQSQNVTGIDTDSDGIFDHLDNDSDNDTCVDAVEGGGNILISQVNGSGQITGSQDSDGVPVLVAGGQANTSEAIDDSDKSRCPCLTIMINRHISTSIKR